MVLTICQRNLTRNKFNCYWLKARLEHKSDVKLLVSLHTRRVNSQGGCLTKHRWKELLWPRCDDVAWLQTEKSHVWKWVSTAQFRFSNYLISPFMTVLAHVNSVLVLRQSTHKCGAMAMRNLCWVGHSWWKQWACAGFFGVFLFNVWGFSNKSNSGSKKTSSTQLYAE